MYLCALEDDPTIGDLLSAAFGLAGHPIHIFDNGTAFVRDVKNHPYDAMICDVMLPERRNGVEIIRQIRTWKPDLPVVLLSGLTTPELLKIKQQFSLCEIVQKPFRIGQLIGVLTELLEQRRKTINNEVA